MPILRQDAWRCFSYHRARLDVGLQLSISGTHLSKSPHPPQPIHHDPCFGRREQMQLLLVSLQRIAQEQGPGQEGARRRAAVGGAVAAVLEHLPGSSGPVGPSLPLESDPAFWVSDLICTDVLHRQSEVPQFRRTV